MRWRVVGTAWAMRMHNNVRGRCGHIVVFAWAMCWHNVGAAWALRGQCVGIAQRLFVHCAGNVWALSVQCVCAERALCMLHCMDIAHMLCGHDDTFRKRVGYDVGSVANAWTMRR